MATRFPAPQADERGSFVIEATIAMCMVLFVLVAFGGLVAYSYVKGVAHSAVDQGVRAGSRVDVNSASVCEQRVRDVLGSILANTGAEVSCSEDGEVVTGRVALDMHVPFMSDSSVTVTGLARKERPPE